MLDEAAARVGGDVGLKAKTVLHSVAAEASAGRYSDALQILAGAATLFEESTSHALKGGFHNELATVLQTLGTTERRPDYFERAVEEYAAAVSHFEQTPHERYVAVSENNLAFLLSIKQGRHAEAHRHLDRAQMIFTRLKDAGSLAEVDETRARVLVAEGNYREANRILAGALKTLEQGGESVRLADALTLQGVVRARLGAFDSSAAVLRRASEMAEGLGALAVAGQASLTLVEEHGARRALAAAEVHEAYQRADEFLKETRDPEDVERLRACARLVMRRLSGMDVRDKNFSFYGAVHELEAKLLSEALEKAGGSVTKAARLLGAPHQTVTTMLRIRHNRLSEKRTPVKKRRRSIIKDPE